MRTPHQSRRGIALITTLLMAATLGAACSDQGEEASDIVSREEARDYQEQSREQELIEKRYANLPAPAAGVVEIDGTPDDELTRDAAASFGGSGSGAEVRIGGNGEEAAFRALCEGEIDIVDSTRTMTRAEWEQCRSVGLDVVQFQIAAEAVVVAIKSETDVGGDCLSTEQVRDLYRAGSPVTNWSQLGLDDVNTEVAGAAPGSSSFTFFGRTVLDAPEPGLTNFRSDYSAYDTDLGTRVFVVGTARTDRLATTYAMRARERDQVRDELVVARQVWQDARRELRIALAERRKGWRDRRPPADQARDEARVQAAYRAEAKARDELNAVRAKYDRVRDRWLKADKARRFVQRSYGHVGYFRFSYYELFEDQLRPFEITLPTGDRNCIFPSQRTIINGQYPLARQVLLTTTVRSLDRREVAEFLEHYLLRAQDQAVEARLVPLPDASVNVQLAWVRGEREPVLLVPEPEESDEPLPTTPPTEVPAR